jgi:hypothetical protein
MKFEHKDILILGDSFCELRSLPVDWPFIVSQKLSNSNEETRGYGFGGTSWWSVRKRLLKELKLHVPKVLILCHTEPNRIPNDYDAGINWTTIKFKKIYSFGDRKKMDEDKQHRIVRAATQYYEELLSSEYCKWAMVSWFKELDELLSIQKIPHVIHFMSFPNCPNYIFQNSMTIEENLFDVATFFHPNAEGDFNHFTEEGSKKLGNRVIELVLNYKTGLQKLAL